MYRTGISTATPQLQAKWMQWARCGMTNGGYGFSWMDSPYGIFILAVAPGSRAEAAGLKAGQQVVEIGGQSTKRMSREQFSALIHSRPAAGFNLKLDDASEIRLPPL
jgi:C-terminal processing protease CtpA/Prc